MTMERIRTAVIGVGSLGQHHARVMATHPNSELIGIVDTDMKRRDKICAMHGARGFDSPASLIGLAQAAVIAVPVMPARCL